MKFHRIVAFLCLLCIVCQTLALSYSGKLKGNAKLVSPNFSARGYQCSAGSGSAAEFATFSFDVIAAPTAFFVRAMFDSDISSTVSVRISASAPSESESCAGVIRGAVGADTAPNVQFIHWVATNGTYFVTIHLATALSEQQNGLYAVSINEASASANTALLPTQWFPPTISGGNCAEGEASPYAHAKWVPDQSGWYDANVVLENPNDDSMKSTLSVWACATASDLPDNGFSTSSTFETCSTNNSNSCVNVGIRQSSLDFAYQNMHVNFGASAILPRFWATAGTTYYFMFGADSGDTANSTGWSALIVEKSRFEALQTSVLFTSPDPSKVNCTANIEDQANAYFYFGKSANDAVVLVDTGATEFDTIGSFYLGNNSARQTCPTSWYTTKDLDENPVAMMISEDFEAASVIISPYGGSGNEGWLVQLWAMSGPPISQLTPTQPPVMTPSSPLAPSGSSAPETGMPASAPAIPIASPTKSPSAATSLAARFSAIVVVLTMLLVM